MGVEFVVDGYYPTNLDHLDFGALLYGTPYGQSSTRVFLDDGQGGTGEFRGSGFKYDGDGGLIAGTVNSMAIFDYEHRAVYIQGFQIKVSSLIPVAYTYGTADDQKLLKSALSGADTFIGGDASDVFRGYAGNDNLSGRAGNDVLRGSDGNDKLNGGIGIDKLYGESGNDSFVFSSSSHSTAKYGIDTIFDFTPSDIIDLHLIDANSKTSGNNGFKFIGASGFSGHAGELRYQKLPSDTYIYADTNGDKKADLAVHLDDAYVFHKEDFVL
jgi:Ca2+-binding RTX toxin-like protein